MINHGTAIMNEPLLNFDDSVIVNIGEEGIVTAYLPEQETFAVMFSGDRWFTFKESEESFLIRFKYNKPNEIT